MSNYIYVLSLEPVGSGNDNCEMYFSSQKRAIQQGLSQIEEKGGVLDIGFTGTKRNQSLFFTGSDDVYYYVCITKRTVF